MNHPENEADSAFDTLNKKALRQLARKHKIKHYYRKSPASLRRALRRKQKQALDKKLKQTNAQESQPLERDLERVKAYEEHRLRYLFAPSKFVHKGTHEAYILEKDDEIDLPDFYREDELVALPIDPQRFYIYWDFAEETLYDVRSWLAEDYPFVLRIHDISQLVFDGQNAHQTWLEPCHPLIREWYLNAPVSGADLCVELGVRLEQGFHLILRSNPIFVPPASVSTIKHDVFAAFVPEQIRVTDPLPAAVEEAFKPETDLPETATAWPATKPETSAHLFFQDYVPSPIKYHPIPPPRDTDQPELFVQLTKPVVAESKPFVPHNTPSRHPAPSESASQAGPEQPEHHRAAPTESQTFEAFQQEIELSQLTQHLNQAAGQEAVQQWLGIPHEIRWLSDLPVGTSALFYEQWVADPYDRAVMISYAIWPWEWTEYLPLGASDQTLRPFLGASLFSWYTPGGSDSRGWKQASGASEQRAWLRPEGASERAWSGLLQTQSSPQQNVWNLWPRSASGRGN